jgi:hypothetical protein
VTLSWKASGPVHNRMPSRAITYRMNSDPRPGTHCIDTAVATGGSILTLSGLSLQMRKRVTLQTRRRRRFRFLKCKTATSEMPILFVLFRAILNYNPERCCTDDT